MNGLRNGVAPKDTSWSFPALETPIEIMDSDGPPHQRS